MDPDSTETAIEKLLNLKRKKMEIQKYTTKAINLSYQASLEDQAIKALIFRRLHSRDENRVMLANLIKMKMKLRIENIKVYLERIIRLL